MQQGLYDAIIIGGGAVGAAIAYGCARLKARVAMLDEGDAAFRAARANHGLIYSQFKGVGAPAYAEWTRQCVNLWPGFADNLSSLTGTDFGFRGGGNVSFCIGDEDFEKKSRDVADAWAQPGGPATPIYALDRKDTVELLPDFPLGLRVTGCIYTPQDSQVNPLLLLRALHAGFMQHGGQLYSGERVTGITAHGGNYLIQSASMTLHTRHVVIAAGLGTTKLAAMVGMNVPIIPTRGQSIITEKVAKIISIGAAGVRQHMEGSIQLGSTFEPNVTDRGVMIADLSRIAARAIEICPPIRNLRVIRTWSGIRPVTPDGLPAYALSKTFPNVLALACHSGVVQTSGHAGPVAEAILSGGALPGHGALSADRFNA